MFTLNLLPPIKRQEIRLTQIYLIIKNLIIFILLLTTIIGVILLITKMTLQNHFNRIIDQTTLTTKHAEIFNKDIKGFNQNIKAVAVIQGNYISWTNFFVNLAKIVPEDINVYNVTINNDKILITGLAKARNNLLKFQENLENTNLFSDVVIPLENLLKKDDVDFDIKANINLVELKTQ